MRIALAFMAGYAAAHILRLAWNHYAVGNYVRAKAQRVLYKWLDKVR